MRVRTRGIALLSALLAAGRRHGRHGRPGRARGGHGDARRRAHGAAHRGEVGQAHRRLPGRLAARHADGGGHHGGPPRVRRPPRGQDRPQRELAHQPPPQPLVGDGVPLAAVDGPARRRVRDHRRPRLPQPGGRGRQGLGEDNPRGGPHHEPVRLGRAPGGAARPRAGLPQPAREGGLAHPQPARARDGAGRTRRCTRRATTTASTRTSACSASAAASASAVAARSPSAGWPPRRSSPSTPRARCRSRRRGTACTCTGG